MDGAMDLEMESNMKGPALNSMSLRARAKKRSVSISDDEEMDKSADDDAEDLLKEDMDVDMVKDMGAELSD